MPTSRRGARTEGVERRCSILTGRRAAEVPNACRSARFTPAPRCYAAVDVAAGAGGYNANGAFTRSGADAGAQVFSQDFERAADYVGLYMALGGWPIDSAPS